MEQRVEIHVGDIIDALQSFFSNIAVPVEGLSQDHTRRNVEVKIGESANEGLLRVRFKAKMGAVVTLKIEVAEFLKDHKKYLEGVMIDVTAAVRDYKYQKWKESPKIIH